MNNEKKELGITKGEWYYVEGVNGDYVRTNMDLLKGSYIASLRADDGSNFDGLTSKETIANARLIADAGTTTNLTGKLPSQLAEENKMMLEALCKISSRLAFLDFGVKSGSASDKQISSAYQISEQAIAKAEGRAE